MSVLMEHTGNGLADNDITREIVPLGERWPPHGQMRGDLAGHSGEPKARSASLTHEELFGKPSVVGDRKVSRERTTAPMGPIATRPVASLDAMSLYPGLMIGPSYGDINRANNKAFGYVICPAWTQQTAPDSFSNTK
jgi:hypothetical protein